MENYFNYHKILKSGYLYYEEKDIRQTFILTENLGHFSTEGVTAPNLPKFELIQAFMHVLDTCKNEEDPIKNEGARVFTRFLPL